jgi:hypothetical protein
MSIDRLARALGYAGLIPFLVFSVGTWVELPGVGDAHYILMTYAAVILSFMGAIHWGVAITMLDGRGVMQLGLSVIPALLAWVALLISPVYGYSLLIVSFVVLCLLDQRAVVGGIMPSWYTPLRVTLTTVVVLCLIAASIAYVLIGSV